MVFCGAVSLWSGDRVRGAARATACFLETRGLPQMTGHRSVGAAVLRAVLALGLLVGRGNCNRFQEAWVMNCDHTFPDGTTYDLSAMTRTAGRPDYVGRDKVGNMYYMNVCGDVQEIPKECRALQKAIRSPVYQVCERAGSACSVEGRTRVHAGPHTHAHTCMNMHDLHRCATTRTATGSGSTPSMSGTL